MPITIRLRMAKITKIMDKIFGPPIDDGDNQMDGLTPGVIGICLLMMFLFIIVFAD